MPVTRLVWLTWLLTLSEAYFFQSGFTHHYTYEADNSMFGQHNVTTVLKASHTFLQIVAARLFFSLPSFNCYCAVPNMGCGLHFAIVGLFGLLLDSIIRS